MSTFLCSQSSIQHLDAAVGKEFDVWKNEIVSDYMRCVWVQVEMIDLFAFLHGSFVQEMQTMDDEMSYNHHSSVKNTAGYFFQVIWTSSAL